MDSPTLRATVRTLTGKQVKQLRQTGQLPAVVYGHDSPSQALAISLADYEKVFSQAGTSTLVNLVIDDSNPVKVLLHEPQYHPVRPAPVHADLYVVKMTEKLQTEIPIHFVGESDAVTILDGTLTTQIDALNVECFPDKLVSVIEVDISSLKTFDDIIRISDIQAPTGIEILNEAEEVVALVTPPRSEEELAELEAAPSGEEADQAAVESVEVTTEKKEEAEAE